MSLCTYKHIFGEPKKGVHQYRLFGLAVVDVGMTLVAAAVIAYIYKKSFLLVSAILFAIGIILHRVFCVDTVVNRAIFGSA